MLTSVDSEVLSLLLLEAEEIIADQVVIIPIAPRPRFFAEWPDQLETGALSGSDLPFIELWHRTDL